MTLYVGTSGWAYPEWRPQFYPEGLGRQRWLQHYASVFGACEINATFYRLQSRATFERWDAATPQGFKFVAKAHRRLTHARRARVEAAFLETFVSSLLPLGAKLGALLFQFPPTLERDDDLLEHLVATLPPGMPFAVEFRHHSWSDESVHDHVARADGGICISDTTAVAPSRLPAGRIGYVRLRAETYSAEQRAAWLQVLLREGEKRDVFAFAKHEGAPAGDPYTGVGLAQWMAGEAG